LSGARRENRGGRGDGPPGAGEPADRRLPDRAVAHLRAVADLPDLTGTGYALAGEIARGGMGTVYRARDLELDREVALKVVGPPDASGDLSSRLRLEARLLARLEHPNLVPVHDAGTLPDGRVFYVMKLVRGMRLDAWRREGPGRTATLRLFQKICEAVAFAHAQGVVHRDLKPENVMVGAFGEALVMDWGVAKVLGSAGAAAGAAARAGAAVVGGSDDAPIAGALPRPGGAAAGAAPSPSPGRTSERASPPSPERTGPTTAPIPGTEPGAVIGTRGYMAPEQARGETERVDGRADIYALGAILHFLLHGRPPGAAPGDASPSPSAPGVPRALDAIRDCAMADDPGARYPTALELSADVDRFLDGLPVAAHRENLLERTGRLLSRHRALVALVLAYLLMRVALIFLRGE